MQSFEAAEVDPEAAILHPSITSGERIFMWAAFLLGFAAGLGRQLDYSFGELRIALAMATVFGVYGWWTGLKDPILRHYVRFALPFVAIGAISFLGTSASDEFQLPLGIGFGEQAAKLLWFLAIAGVAVTLQNPRLLRATFYGLITAAVIYLLSALQRVVGHHPALNDDDLLLHTHRNIVDTFLVSLVPIVLTAPFLKMRMVWRLALVGGTVIWIINSHGRTGALALGLCPILLYVLRMPKNGGSLVPRVLAGAAVGFVLFNVLSTHHISWLPAATRITEAKNGTQSESDEIRTILLKKAYSLTEKHPVLGIGIGRFPGSYDPVVEEATTAHVRTESIRLQAHNTWMEMLASTGIVGEFFFLGLILVPLIAALRYCYDTDVRAVTVSYCLVLFCVTFHTMLDAALFIPIAMTLTFAIRAARREAAAEANALPNDLSSLAP